MNTVGLLTLALCAFVLTSVYLHFYRQTDDLLTGRIALEGSRTEQSREQSVEPPTEVDAFEEPDEGVVRCPYCRVTNESHTMFMYCQNCVKRLYG